MELSDLVVFRTVVEAGGITKAAGRLNRVQSNVTARMKKLEEDLGAELFTRQGRGLTLAPAGIALLPYAERMIDLAEEARQAVRGDSLGGPLRLGTMESTAAVRLPLPLAAFHRRYPEIILDLRTNSTEPLIAQVLRGELDAALIAGPVEDARLERRTVFTENLVVVVPAGHSPFRDGGGLTLLTFKPGCAYRKILETWVAAQGAVPDRLVEMNSYHGMLGCVSAGMGIALMPVSLIESYPGAAGLSLLPLPPETGRVDTLLVWRKAGPRARIAALADILLAATQDVPAA